MDKVSLKINAESFSESLAKYLVASKKDFEPVPSLYMSRHKSMWRESAVNTVVHKVPCFSLSLF